MEGIQSQHSLVGTGFSLPFTLFTAFILVEGVRPNPVMKPGTRRGDACYEPFIAFPYELWYRVSPICPASPFVLYEVILYI